MFQYGTVPQLCGTPTPQLHSYMLHPIHNYVVHQLPSSIFKCFNSVIEQGVRAIIIAKSHTSFYFSRKQNICIALGRFYYLLPWNLRGCCRCCLECARSVHHSGVDSDAACLLPMHHSGDWLWWDCLNYLCIGIRSFWLQQTNFGLSIMSRADATWDFCKQGS